MNKADNEIFRQRLLGMLRRLNGDISHLADEALRTSQKDGSGSLSSMPIHMADMGSDAFEQEFTLNLLANQEQVLEEIHDALERLKEGTFGQCENCQGGIPKQRLKAVPYARYCVACARKLEETS